jgi:hypothetical protein
MHVAPSRHISHTSAASAAAVDLAVACLFLRAAHRKTPVLQNKTCTVTACCLLPALLASFAPALVFYGPAELLPSGAPGDPALEYNRKTRGSCGTFTSGATAALFVAAAGTMRNDLMTSSSAALTHY